MILNMNNDHDDLCDNYYEAVDHDDHVHLDYYHHYESNNHDDHYELDYDNHNESDDHESWWSLWLWCTLSR